MTDRYRLLFAVVATAVCLNLILPTVKAVEAVDIQLAWDEPVLTEGGLVPAHLAGYLLYYGERSQTYGEPIDVGNQTSYVLTGLTYGQRYFLAVTAYDFEGNESPLSTEISVIASVPPAPAASVIPQSEMSVVFVDSEEVEGGDGEAYHAIDGLPDTSWGTEWYNQEPPHPHGIALELARPYLVEGFSYLPRQDGLPDGTILEYLFYVSEDGHNWGDPVAAGVFSGDGAESTVTFPGKVGRFVSLVALSEVNGKPWTSAAEINILGTAVSQTAP